VSIERRFIGQSSFSRTDQRHNMVSAGLLQSRPVVIVEDLPISLAMATLPEAARNDSQLSPGW
jgi:hypothetical protein